MDFTWDKSYSVNHKIIDTQHRKLLDLFDRASKLLLEENNSVNTLELISELTVYSIFHFSEEEALMKANDYPDLIPHQLEHETFINHINEFKESVTHNTSLLNEDIFLFLAEWIINHIKETDSKYKSIIND